MINDPSILHWRMGEVQWSISEPRNTKTRPGTSAAVQWTQGFSRETKIVVVPRTLKYLVWQFRSDINYRIIYGKCIRKMFSMTRFNGESSSCKGQRHFPGKRRFVFYLEVSELQLHFANIW